MTMFKDVNRIIFDLDNTLICHDFDRESEIVIKKLGLEGVPEFKLQLYNFFSQNIARLKWKPITEEIYIRFIEETMPLLREQGKTGKDFLEVMYYSEPGCLMDGAKEILEYLHDKNYEIVALTNWFYMHQTRMLKHLGILDYFERVFAWDDYYPKPNRLAVIRALDSTAPSENVVIGDDPIGDISVSKSCGIRTIGFKIDYSGIKKCSKIEKADVNVSNLLEIKSYL